MTEREMPSSRDAERSILGAILLDAVSYSETAGAKLAAEHFSLDSHRRIYTRIVELGESGSAVDLVSLAEELRRARELEAVGGVAYLSSLTDGVPRRPSIEQHIRLVKDKALLRQIIALSSNLGAAALEEAETPAELLAIYEAKLTALRDGGVTDPWRSAEDCMRQTLNAWAGMRGSQDLIGLTTGIAPMDILTTGIRPYEYWVVGARPNIGKTPLLMQMALANAKAGRRVAVLSMEMSATQLMFRCMSHAGCAASWQVRNNRLLEDDAYRLAGQRAIEQVGSLPLWIRTGRHSISDACAEVRQAINKYGVELVLLDYLQLADAPGKNGYERVSEASTAIDKVIDKTGVPWVVASQLNRDAKDPRRWPQLGDLRESGVIEQDADVVILIHREPNEHEEPTEVGHLILAKQREGAKGHEPVLFDERSLTFQARPRT